MSITHTPPPILIKGREGGTARSPNDAGNGARHVTPDGAPVTAAYVIARLEEAGETLLSLPFNGPTPHLRTSVWPLSPDALHGYAATDARLRPPIPSPAAITRMDEAFAWLQLIEQHRYVLRRILATRALVNPTTGKHLHPWRRLATLLGADHKAIQRWHAQAVGLLVAALNAPRPG